MGIVKHEVVFTVDFSGTTREVKSYYKSNGSFVNNRLLQIRFNRWIGGYFMELTVIEEVFTKKVGKFLITLTTKDFYDGDFPQQSNAMASMQDIRGETANNMALRLAADIGKEFVDEYFPITDKE